MSDNDTIVAQATPPGRGGVGILRISGFKAREVAETVLGKLPKPRYADYLPRNNFPAEISASFPHPFRIHTAFHAECFPTFGLTPQSDMY